MVRKPEEPQPDLGLFGRLHADLEQRERMAGMTPADLLDLPQDERRVVQVLARRGELSLDELAASTGLDPAGVEALVESLSGKSFVRVAEVRGKRTYRTYFGRRRVGQVPLDIWQKLSDMTGTGEDNIAER